MGTIVRIAIIGFMGSGKSTVGKALSRKLGFSFIDLDAWIEKEEEKTIKEIFKDSNEDYFRRVETKLLKNVSGRKKVVVATGGGIIERKKNRDLLRDNFYVIYLEAPLEILYTRIKGDSKRPKLKLGEKGVRELFRRRLPLYKSVSNTIVSIEGKTPLNIVEQITGNLRDLRNENL